GITIPKPTIIMGSAIKILLPIIYVSRPAISSQPRIRYRRFRTLRYVFTGRSSLVPVADISWILLRMRRLRPAAAPCGRVRRGCVRPTVSREHSAPRHGRDSQTPGRPTPPLVVHVCIRATEILYAIGCLSTTRPCASAASATTAPTRSTLEAVSADDGQSATALPRRTHDQHECLAAACWRAGRSPACHLRIVATPTPDPEPGVPRPLSGTDSRTPLGPTAL